VDLGVPSRTSPQNATLTLTVSRNQFPPVFQKTPYSFKTDEKTTVGSEVYRVVTATDQDKVVSCDVLYFYG
jgi:hypothetical protein